MNTNNYCNSVELTSKQKTQCIEYALIMLGAPVIDLEIDKDVVGVLAEKAADYIKERLDGLSEYDYTELVKWGTFCYAQKVLGEMRCRYKQPRGQIDGITLVNEASEQLLDWHRKIRKYQKGKYGKK